MDEELYIPTAVRVISKAAQALGLIHACHVAHRDVKPANILLDGHDSCGVYLCDLGLGRDLEIATCEQMRDGAGTPMYMAPERLLKAPANEILCDLYSLGVTLFETLTLGRPFDTPGELPLACLSANLAHAEPKAPRRLKPDLPPIWRQSSSRPCLEIPETAINPLKRSRLSSTSSCASVTAGSDGSPRTIRKPAAPLPTS